MLTFTRRFKSSIPLFSLASIWRESKHLIDIAAPLILSQLVMICMGLIDTCFLADMGVAEIAGAGLGIHCFRLGASILGGAMSILGVYTFQGHSKNPINDGLWFALFLSFFYLLGLFAAPTVLSFCGQDAKSLALAKIYLKPLYWATFPYLAYCAGRQVFVVQKRTRFLFYISLGGLFCNYLGNSVLAPIYGIKGIAWVTTFSYLAIFVLQWMVLGLRQSIGKPSWTNIKELLNLGLPVSATCMCDMGMFFMHALLVGSFGFVALAGHQIVLQWVFLTYIVPYALSMALSIRVAEFRKEVSGIGDVAALFSAILLGELFISFCILGIIFWPEVFPRHFLDMNLDGQDALLRKIVSLWPFVCGFQVLNSLQVLLQGWMRGMRETRSTFFVCFLSYWVLGLPFAFCLSQYFGVRGTWLGLSSGLLLFCVWQFYRFSHKLHQRYQKRLVLTH
ncbi:MAG: hypothetical protein CMO81_06025 [Waddliaceae bacterium]|nr:hypothetical protein [Waddliaceae bacterium]